MNEPAQDVEQIRYASLLQACTLGGIVLLVLAFAAYALGVLEPAVPVHRLPALWHLPLKDYLAASSSPSGWQWLRRLAQGDMLSLAGIAFLAGCSSVPLLAAAALYLRRGARALAALCVAEVLVLALAASGVLAGGH